MVSLIKGKLEKNYFQLVSLHSKLNL